MKLLIPAEVEAKLHAYVRSVKTEIAGMGKATILPSGDILMTDIAIYEQEVTGGTADLSSEALAKFQTELIQKGESPKDWIVWWHSHADMGAFFSGRDTATIDSSDEFQYLVSLVVNRRRERKARLDQYRPFRFLKDNLDIVVGPHNDEIPQEIKDEVEAKVHIKSAYTTPYRMGYQQTLLPKALPAGSVDDYDGLPGGLEKKGVSGMDEDDILPIVDALKDQISQFEAAGNGDTQECIELREDLGDWEYELQIRADTNELMDKVIDHNAKN